jgi:integrase
MDYFERHPMSFERRSKERVILKKGKPLTEIMANYGLRKAIEKAGLIWGEVKSNGVVPHDLRHSFSTHMRKAGVDFLVKEKAMGHSTGGFEIAKTYDQVDDDDLKNASMKLEAWRKEQYQPTDKPATVVQSVEHKVVSIKQSIR